MEAEAGICFAAVLGLALLLYARTLAPTVTLVDSGELILAAHSLGVAHPPGFPLYVLLAHLASLIPLGNVAVRVNFASAVFAALAAGMMTLVVHELSALALPGSKRARANKHTWVAAVAAGLLLASSRTLWAYAAIAEVYTLNALLILVVLYLMLRWRRARADGWLYAAAGVFGLALGVHHVTVAAVLPGIAVLVYRTEGWPFFASKRLLIAALISFGALFLIYSYLPFAASRDPILNWGNPRSLAAVWRHLSGWQYQSYLSFDVTALGGEFASFLRLLLREFGPPWLPCALLAALLGAYLAFKRDRTTFWLLTLIIAVNAGYNLTYSIAEDKDAYYLPTFIAFVAFVALALHYLTDRRALSLSAGLGLGAIALSANWRYDNRSRYFLAQDYVANIEHSIAPNGLLLTLDWQVQSPMLYTREVEGRRRDIKTIDINLLRRSWYFDYLQRAYPEMIARSRPAVDAFLAELRPWESDPASYARNPRLAQRISTAFTELCQSLVRQESGIGPVYLTSEVLLAPGPESKAFAQWLATSYNPVPKGLVFELFDSRGFHDPGELQLQTRGLVDGTLHFESDDVVKQKVLPAYEIMLVNRGRYLALFTQHARAAEAFQRALELDPGFELAREGLNLSLAKLPKQ